jgi:nucleotide-binding universal stress UspA family protein
MLRRLLVPLDGSPFAETALPAALTIAENMDGEIRLVSVLEPVVLERPELQAGDVDWSERYLADVAERIRKRWDGPVSRGVFAGRAAETITSEAVDSAADAIVMSTHGRGGLSRLWLGSVADRCVRSGVCPVLLVRPGDVGKDLGGRLAVRRVVVPLDGSELAERALPYASELATAFASPVLLLRTTAYPAHIGTPYLPEVMQLTQELAEQDLQRASAYLDAQVERLRSSGIDASSLLVDEPGPARAILARDEGDLIVMSTHGRGGFDRAVFGSVTDKVVRNSEASVLVIPAEQDRDASSQRSGRRR